MDSIGKGPTNSLDPTYGSLLVGVIIAAMFQGMLMVQAYNYYENFPNDRLRNKFTILLILILDTTHLILIVKAAYSSLVTNWGYIPSLGFATIELNLHLAFTALSCLVAQLFFLTRIWTFSRKNVWTTAVLLLLILTPAVMEFHITSLIVQDTSIAEYERNKLETIIMFIVTAIADISLAGMMCYYLREEQGTFEGTRSVVSKALHLVVGSGLATSMIAIGSLILYLTSKNTFYFISLHFQLGRTYTNALLLTLNARQQMRQIMGDSYKSSRSNQMELGVVSNGRGATRDVDNIICIVQKHTETDNMEDQKSLKSEWLPRDRKSRSAINDTTRNQISFVDI